MDDENMKDNGSSTVGEVDHKEIYLLETKRAAITFGWETKKTQAIVRLLISGPLVMIVDCEAVFDR